MLTQVGADPAPPGTCDTMEKCCFMSVASTRLITNERRALWSAWGRSLMKLQPSWYSVLNAKALREEERKGSGTWNLYFSNACCGQLNSPKVNRKCGEVG